LLAYLSTSANIRLSMMVGPLTRYLAVEAGKPGRRTGDHRLPPSRVRTIRDPLSTVITPSAQVTLG
jgi:hypothetical protein